ncbi:hypothetical protein OG568_49750 (plasmid) [Streptomyces sp. NBC_01450]|uniref:hypothetical protein n=1 Tax=Streptomyces sp. NBC_01450 TaxID=2903871 RepID=UPI002E3037C3|nr:hypothetical protein [Streptomyces sp. NBC_01450]
MTSLPTPPTSDRWLLQITIQAARADDTRWREQLAALRSVSSYDPDTQTWSTFIGALNLTAVRTLQALFDAARSFGADIQLEAAPVPASWQGRARVRWPPSSRRRPTRAGHSANFPRTDQRA